MKKLLLTLLIMGATFAANTTQNETITYTHAPITIPNTPVDFNILLALIFIAIGLYGMLYYALFLFKK